MSRAQTRFSHALAACTLVMTDRAAIYPPPTRFKYLGVSMRLVATPLLLPSLILGLSLHSFAVRAVEPSPEIERPTGTAQAIGVVHTLRQIPEACTRLEGTFTADASARYRFVAVRSSANCQPRARFVDAASASPDIAGGWTLNDEIRVPSVECPAQQAVVRVWRKPVEQTVELDAQGKSRIYLADVKKNVAAARQVAVPLFAAVMAVEGKACR